MDCREVEAWLTDGAAGDRDRQPDGLVEHLHGCSRCATRVAQAGVAIDGGGSPAAASTADRSDSGAGSRRRRKGGSRRAPPDDGERSAGDPGSGIGLWQRCQGIIASLSATGRLVLVAGVLVALLAGIGFWRSPGPRLTGGDRLLLSGSGGICWVDAPVPQTTAGQDLGAVGGVRCSGQTAVRLAGADSRLRVADALGREIEVTGAGDLRLTGDGFATERLIGRATFRGRGTTFRVAVPQAILAIDGSTIEFSIGGDGLDRLWLVEGGAFVVITEGARIGTWTWPVGSTFALGLDGWSPPVVATRSPLLTIDAVGALPVVPSAGGAGLGGPTGQSRHPGPQLPSDAGAAGEGAGVIGAASGAEVMPAGVHEEPSGSAGPGSGAPEDARRGATGGDNAADSPPGGGEPVGAAADPPLEPVADPASTSIGGGHGGGPP